MHLTEKKIPSPLLPACSWIIPLVPKHQGVSCEERQNTLNVLV